MDIGIDFGRVARVYSGVAHRCACGCSGKYFDAELDPAKARFVIGKILSAKKIDHGGEHVSAVVGKRLYAAFYKDPVRDFLVRAEDYAAKHGDATSFSNLFRDFRAYNDVRDSTRMALTSLYGVDVARKLEGVQ